MKFLFGIVRDLSPLLQFTVIGAAPFVAIAFCILRFKHSSGTAFLLAVSFVCGAAVGLALAMNAAMIAMDKDGLLESDFVFGFYLICVLAAGAAGGVVAMQRRLRRIEGKFPEPLYPSDR